MSDDSTKAIATADDVEALFAIDDLATIDVYVPEWKKTFRLRQLTAADSLILADAPRRDSMLLIVAMSVVDASGSRLFKDHERLRGRSAGALNLLQTEALKLNGFSVNMVAAVAAAASAKNG
jgi:hypothetical protein